MDGNEQWRNEGAGAEFVVPIPRAKVVIEFAPIGLQPLIDLLNEWAGFDGAGQQADASPGLPSIVFSKMTIDSWSKIFDPLRHGSIGRVIDLRFTLPLQSVTAVCQRRWLCVNGRWVRQAERRVEESAHPIEPPRVIAYNGPVPEGNELVVVANRAVIQWNAALQAERNRKAFADRCTTGK